MTITVHLRNGFAATTEVTAADLATLLDDAEQDRHDATYRLPTREGPFAFRATQVARIEVAL